MTAIFLLSFNQFLILITFVVLMSDVIDCTLICDCGATEIELSPAPIVPFTTQNSITEYHLWFEMNIDVILMNVEISCQRTAAAATCSHTRCFLPAFAENRSVSFSNDDHIPLQVRDRLI
jgi:hypothetical protein